MGTLWRQVRVHHRQHGRQLSSVIAFTLVELLVVITIILILASLLMPALGDARLAAQMVACKNNLRQIGVGCFSYMGDFERLPLFTNVGNAKAHCLRNWACRLPVGTNYDGLGRLLQSEYVPISDAFRCPGRSDHGLGSATTQWYCDYVIGWYSGDDIWWGGMYGLQLKRSDGTTYSPRGGEWNIPAPPSPLPSYYYKFSPTIEQYINEWQRGPTFARAKPAGAVILAADVKSFNSAPMGIPHGEAASCLLVDGRVTSLKSAFGSGETATLTYNASNAMPHHEYGEQWWKWAESKLR